MKIGTVICIGFVVVFIVALIVVSVGWHSFEMAKSDRFNKAVLTLDNDLLQDGLRLQDADIGSPAIRIYLNTSIAFVAKCQELKVTIVYVQVNTFLENKMYFVFTSDYAIAYIYTIRR